MRKTEIEKRIPPIDAAAPTRTETATFALGRFWGPDAQFGVLPGIVRTRVGYTGGITKNPVYMSLGDHSEALQIDYDPHRISYEDLMDMFWSSHDPSVRSWSRQYRAAIFYHTDYQKSMALETRSHVQAAVTGEIVTEILPFTAFYVAEDYHQKHALQHSHEFMQEFKSWYPLFRDVISSTAAARVNGYLGGYGTSEILESELGSYGLSAKAKEHLFAFVREATRYRCRKTGVC